jgi:hypothetical protein
MSGYGAILRRSKFRKFSHHKDGRMVSTASGVSGTGGKKISSENSDVSSKKKCGEEDENMNAGCSIGPWPT